jgi:two-component system sensor kinase
MSAKTLARRSAPSISNRKFIAVGLLSATLLAGFIGLGYWTASRLHDAVVLSEHSTQIRGELRLARSTMREMEVAQLSDLVTGDGRYRGAYARAHDRMAGEVALLKELTADNEAQQARLVRLHALIEQKHVELQKVMDARARQGYDAARTVFESEGASQLADDIQRTLQQLENEEENLLVERRAQEATNLQRTFAFSTFLAALLAILLGAVAYLLRREMVLHHVHERALADSNVALESKVQERTRSLEESEARLDAILNGAPDAIISVDEAQTIVVANPAAAAMFRYSERELLGAPLTKLIPERFRGSHAAHVRHFGETNIAKRRMSALRVVHGVRADGSEFPIDASISQVTIDGHKLYTVILRDITDEYRAKTELERSRRELRELTAAMEWVQEEERKRIAQELHDDLGQQLTVLKMDASMLKSRLAREQSDALRMAERLDGVLVQTVQSLRRISADLRPAMLDDLGLVPALEQLLQQIGQRTGLAYELDASPDVEIDDRLKMPLYRVVQESLNNVVKHAQATQVTVSLAEADSHLVVSVRDNGKGMQESTPGKRKSFGLIGMRERVYTLGGEFRVSSVPQQGTTVEVRIPVA